MAIVDAGTVGLARENNFKDVASIENAYACDLFMPHFKIHLIAINQSERMRNDHMPSVYRMADPKEEYVNWVRVI